MVWKDSNDCLGECSWILKWLKCLTELNSMPWDSAAVSWINLDLAYSQWGKTLFNFFNREMYTQRQINRWFKKEFPVVCIIIVVLLAVMVFSLIFARHFRSQISVGVAGGKHLQTNTSKNLGRNNSSEVKVRVEGSKSKDLVYESKTDKLAEIKIHLALNRTAP